MSFMQNLNVRTSRLDWEPGIQSTTTSRSGAREQSRARQHYHPNGHCRRNKKRAIQDGFRRPIFPLILLFAIILLAAGCRKDNDPAEASTAAAIQLVDAVGDTIRLRHPAERVVTLAPNLTEMMYAVGAGSKLVGRTAFCDYPQQALQLPIMGDMLNIEYEKILAAKPDIVLMTIAGNSQAGYDKLKELGLRPVAIDAATVQGVIRSLDTVGILVGQQHQSNELVAGLQQTLDSVKQLTARLPSVSTFIVIDRSMLMSVSRGFIQEALVIAGGENIAAEAAAAYPVISREELLRKNPEAIILPAKTEADAESLLELYPEWRALRAVRNERVSIIHPDFILRPGPRLVEGIVRLYQLLHPHQ